MAKTPRPKIYSKFWQFLKKNHKPLLIISAILFFILTFIVSVAGGLRVFFPYAASITGFPFAQKNYLVLFQNNYELRPTGGFISSFANLQFQSGFPTKIEIEDVYGTVDDHEYLKGPYPMEELLADQWYKGYTFRDGNFNPDFPSSSEELIRLYQINNPDAKIDGVFSVNFNLLSDLLDAVGPVEVEGKILNSQNLFEEITNSVNDVDRHNVESLANRKSILKPLANQLIKKILFNPFKLRKVSDTITLALAQKDLQLYFRDTNLQEFIIKNRWGGAWPATLTTDGSQSLQDFLAVTEANLGGMKSDRYLQRNITYKVKISEAALEGDENAQAELTVEVTHFGIENIPFSGPYTGYFRFFKHPFEEQPEDEIIKLNPGQSKTISKTFELSPEVIQENLYSLYLTKQSGTNDYYTVIIEAPRGYRINSDDFEPLENIAYFQGKITKDLQLNLEILPDQLPPRLVLQQNTELNHISLHFNEDLNQDFASDPFSYQVTDLNSANPKTDQLTIRRIETTSKDVHIYLNGQTNQPEEHYSVRLKNLRDTHGNILSDREITVVQRLN